MNGLTGATARATAAGRKRSAVAALALLALLALLTPAAANAGGITNGGNDRRDGWYPNQPGLSPDVVGGPTFGQRWDMPVDGQVYAQPLVDGDHVVVATERNQVYSFDGETGAQQWHTTLVGAPFQAQDLGCWDLQPDIGVTATPVIDPATNTIYVTHKGYTQQNGKDVARWWLDALDGATGQERDGFPVVLSGTADNAPGVTFAPRTQMQRPGLLLLDGVIYVAFGSHCDFGPWQGWVFGVTTAGTTKARWVAVDTGANGAGIWQSGSGIMSDGSGRLFVSTGNGGSPTPGTPGTSPGGQLGESVIRLAVQADGKLQAKDFFAPLDAANLDDWDADFASGGVTALDDVFSTTATPHLAIAVGKSGYVYVLDRDDLGGMATGTNGGDRVVQQLGPYGGVWSRPAVWPGDGGWVYVPTASGVGNVYTGGSGALQVFQNAPRAGGKPGLALAASSEDAFGFGTSAPVVTSDGTTSGSALVWVVWMATGGGDNAQLRAYDAVPQSGKAHLRGSWPVGQGTKFNPPGIGNGRVYVATRDGHVRAFGAPVDAAVSGGSTTFDPTIVGQTRTRTVTLKAGSPVTITGVSASPSAFSADTSGVTLPAALATGETLPVPVSFTPSASGPIGGTLSVTTNQGPFTFTLTGTGQAAVAELSCPPKVIEFQGVVIGQSRTETIRICNSGNSDLVISGIDAPTAPFSLGNAPTDGTVVAPGQTISMDATFAPESPGPVTSETVIHTNGGEATVGLSGAGALGPKLEITPGAVDFGEVAAGSGMAERTFTVTNAGDAAVRIMKSKPPALGQFTALDALDEGTALAPGDSRTLRVRFAPTSAGPQSDAWALTADDGLGPRGVALAGTGVTGTGDAGGGSTPPSESEPGPAPSLTPPMPGPDLPGVTGSGVPEAPPRAVAGLQVLRPVLARDRRSLTVRARLDRRAVGLVTGWLHLRNGRRRWTRVVHARPRDGAVVLRVRLAGTLRGLRSARVTVRFAGDPAVLPAIRRVTFMRR